MWWFSIYISWQRMDLQTSLLPEIWNQRHLFYYEGDNNFKYERQWPHGSFGGTYRLNEASKGALVVPINGCNIMDASKLSSFWVWTHFATYHTSHNRSNYAVYRVCYDLKDSDGTARVKNHTEYELAYCLKRSTSKLL